MAHQWVLAIYSLARVFREKNCSAFRRISVELRFPYRRILRKVLPDAGRRTRFASITSRWDHSMNADTILFWPVILGMVRLIPWAAGSGANRTDVEASLHQLRWELPGRVGFKLPPFPLPVFDHELPNVPQTLVLVSSWHCPLVVRPWQSLARSGCHQSLLPCAAFNPASPSLSLFHLVPARFIFTGIEGVATSAIGKSPPAMTASVSGRGPAGTNPGSPGPKGPTRRPARRCPRTPGRDRTPSLLRPCPGRCPPGEYPKLRGAGPGPTRSISTKAHRRESARAWLSWHRWNRLPFWAVSSLWARRNAWFSFSPILP